MVDYVSVNKGFSKQAPKFDEEDNSNPILQWMRSRVRQHTERYLNPTSKILEINAGTGIDAQYFADKGYQVHATELSDGMLAQLKRRASLSDSPFSIQQLSFTRLNDVEGAPYDFIFSNFGGLNCVSDLHEVSKNIAGIINPGAHITIVIMPPVSPWEIGAALKGNFKMAFRRFKKGGADSHIEGEYFLTHYFSPTHVQLAFGSDYKIVAVEGLASFCPPPHKKEFSLKHKTLFSALKAADEKLCTSYPFNRWADHLIITLKYLPPAFEVPVTTFAINRAPTKNTGKRITIQSAHLGLPSKSPGFVLFKRTFDVLFSAVFSIAVLSWLIPLIALLIKIDSKGPVFFVQKRTGHLDREFDCIKFRTMRKSDTSHLNQTGHHDAVITRLGNFLRSTNMDELPQFINVLMGDMSVIGPRPHMLKHTTEFAEGINNYSIRHSVKPGITGLAQVKGWRGPTSGFRSIYKRVQWDIYYVYHRSAGLDTYIFLATIKEVSTNFLKQVFQS